MFSLYQHDLTHIDNYDSVEEAIEKCLLYWHESDDRPAYVVLSDERLVATIAPVGRDKAMVIRVSGQCDGVTDIKYGEGCTTCRVNGTEKRIS